MRRIFRRAALIAAAVLLLGLLPAPVAGEDEVSLFDLGSGDPMPTPGPEPTSSAAKDPLADTALAEEAGSGSLSDTVVITLSAVGDITFGGDVRKKGQSIFDKELAKQGGSLSFVMRNVRDILSADDITVGNFETTLTTAPVYKTSNEFVFSAPPSYVEILTDGSFEAVSFENNHAMDHGQQGWDETTATLESAGIVWSAAGHPGVFEVKGVSVCLLSYQTFNGRYPALFEQVPLDVAGAKALYDIVVVNYHWGAELDYVPNENQVKLGRLTIDAGADLVLGHHSHRINPIEQYQGKYIVYSLGNFSFAGNSKPSDMSTFIFQTRFTVREGKAEPKDFRIIPCRISSKADYNDFAPTPFAQQMPIDNVVSVLQANGKKLAHAVSSYPLDFE